MKRKADHKENVLAGPTHIGALIEAEALVLLDRD